MTTRIEKAKRIFFEDKDHYLAFRKAWAKYTSRTPNEHIIYNLLRGYDIHRGFTPITKESKLNNGFLINHGLYNAYKHVRRATESAQNILAGKPTKYAAHWSRGKQITVEQNDVNVALATWEGTLTIEMLAKLDELMPNIKPLDPHWGKGIKIAEELIKIHRQLHSESKPLDSEAQRILYDNLWEMCG